MTKRMIVSTTRARQLGQASQVVIVPPRVFSPVSDRSIEYSISGIGAQRSYRRYPGKSFATSRAVNYIDPHDAADKAIRNPGDHFANGVWVTNVEAKAANTARKRRATMAKKAQTSL